LYDIHAPSEGSLREDDREKFVMLANSRVNKAIKAIHLIGNLSNRSNYDYTDEDVSKIFRALNDEINTCKRRFELASKKAPDTTFKLD
jgi:hypothetical protein